MTNGRPRRRSIFTGVLLIVLGALFLWHNLRGSFLLWDLLERWWPLLLIVWGLAKLYDHLAARRTGEAPPRTVTGGEVLLVFLVLGLAFCVGLTEWAREHGTMGDFRWPPWEQRYSFSEEVPAQSVPADARISIRTDRGDITVHSEDAAEIRVLVKKTVTASDEGDARRRAEQVRVAVTENAGTYEVGPQSQGGQVQVDLEVHVPRRAGITARTARGGVRAIGVAGSVTASAQHGDLEIRNAGGDVSAQLDRGDAHIVGAGGDVKVSGRGGQIEVADVKGEAVIQGEYYGPIRIAKVDKGARFVSRRTDLRVSQLPGRIETRSGSMDISDAAGNFSLVTREYDVALDNVAGRVHIEDREGNVKLRFSQPPREDVEVTDKSGNIELVLPAKSSFEIHAESRKGEIDSEFDDAALKPIRERDNSKLDGTRGTKGPQIHLRTSYGTIHLRKTE
jgi:hypothetical protein